jgi:hypothetical protein
MERSSAPVGSGIFRCRSGCRPGGRGWLNPQRVPICQSVAMKPTSSAFSAVSRAEILRPACYDRASMPIPSRAPSYESILQHFRARRGLYLIGAGASAGLAPLGAKLYRVVALDWWHGGGFPAVIPAVHAPLNRKIIESQSGCPQTEIWGREIRPGTEPFPIVEMLIRLPEYWTRIRTKHELVKVRYEDRRTRPQNDRKCGGLIFNISCFYAGAKPLSNSPKQWLWKIAAARRI